MKTWKITLTRDEIIALAKAMDSYIERMKFQEDSDEKATTYVNLCRVIAKIPDEDWFEEEVSV